MRKIFTMVAMIFATMLIATSCDNTKPNFHYQVDVDGSLGFTEQSTVSTFTAFVSNVTTVTPLSITTEVEPRTMDSISTSAEDYFYKQIKAAVPENALYNINIKGYATEMNTGITIATDKTFTNSPAPIVDIVRPVYQNIPTSYIRDCRIAAVR